jgi:hypothetical protein
MLMSRSRVAVVAILRLVGDLVDLVVGAVQSRAQLSAENLFLRKQLALYVERQVKPRRADDATRITLVALSWLIDWRRVLTVVKPDTLMRLHRKGFQLVWRWKSRPRDWVEKKIRYHLARASQRHGFGWKRWSREWLYGTLGLFHAYYVAY